MKWGEHHFMDRTRCMAFGSGFKTVEEMGKEELSRGIYLLKRCVLVLPAVTIFFLFKPLVLGNGYRK